MWEVGQLQDDQIAGCIHGGMLNQGPICALLTIFIFLILQQLGAQTILITGVRIPGLHKFNKLASLMSEIEMPMRLVSSLGSSS